MTLDEYNTYCSSLPHAHKVVQWGDAHVWKIDKKMFAVGGWQNVKTTERKRGETAGSDIEQLYITFKVGEIAFEFLSEVEGCRPAPYLASRGMKWIQRTGDGYMSDADLKTYIKDSYTLASKNLTKKKQKELGLNQGGGI